jgi:hypothetical protein
MRRRSGRIGEHAHARIADLHHLAGAHLAGLAQLSRPSTWTRPSAIIAFAPPPLAARPVVFNSASRVM